MEEEYFFKFNLKELGPSSWRDDLQVDPKGKYKFGSVDINMEGFINKINRQTYSSADMLGDIGGFSKAIKLIFEFMIWPFVSFNLASVKLSRLFRQQPILE